MDAVLRAVDEATGARPDTLDAEARAVHERARDEATVRQSAITGSSDD